MPIPLNQITKSLITSLIVAPAFASFAKGDSMKGKDKGTDAFDGSIERSLYYAYHGDPDKDIASHAMMFCSMTGNIFSKMIEKNFATSESVICAEREIQNVSRETVERVRLNLDMLLRLNDYVVLDNKLSIGILRPTLQAAKKTPKATIQPRSLKNTFERDVSSVKKIIAIAKDFLDSNGDIPSGKTIDDLVAFIWAACWKQHSFDVGRKNKRKQSSKDDEKSDDDDDTEGQQDDPQNLNESNELVEIPDDFTPPELTLNGKWMPKGWVVYVVYVCRHTRCCDDLVHFYVGDGQLLDHSKAKSRSREREDTKKKGSNKESKCPRSGHDGDKDMTLEQKQVSIQLAQSRSKDNHSRLTSKVIQCQMEVSSLQQQQSSLWEMMMVMHNNDVAVMKESDEWKEFCCVRDDLREARKEHKAAKEELTKFECNDTFGEVSRQMLAQIAMGNDIDDKNSTRGPLTPMSKKHAVVCVANRAETATPVSQLSNSAFPTGVCCAGEMLCNAPMMELRENHVCKTCHGLVHMLCVGIPVNDPDDDVVCKKCYVLRINA